MAKRITYNIITGNDPRLRVCFYYSPHFEMNIWRRGSSLTGERTKKDPAFKGFRQSSNRLKQASPIAASLYKLVPEKVKQYALYRTLTGRAIKLLKEGLETSVITEILKKEYIDPLLDAPARSENRSKDKSVSGDRIKGMTDFTSFPQIPSGNRKTRRKRRPVSIHQFSERQSAPGYFSPTGPGHLRQTSRNISESPSGERGAPEPAKRRLKTTSGLIYLGRLAECKKLKIWLRPISSSLP